MSGWAQVGPTILASFLASMVECVEASTVVLAVGATRGWRETLMGAGAALATLVLLIWLLGPSVSKLSLPAARLLIGALALLFGMRWLRKSILRSAGIIALHDETGEYRRQSASLRQHERPKRGAWDGLAFGTSFNIVLFEGIEVVFIVVAIAANSRLLGWAVLGAAAALACVAVLAASLHRPLARIPENVMKFAVGVLLASFGTKWVGEGLQLRWPAGDLSMLALIAGYAIWGRALVSLSRHGILPRRNATPASPQTSRPIRSRALAGFIACFDLFIEDRRLALGIVAWIGIFALCATQLGSWMIAGSCLLFCGFALLLGYSSVRAAAPRRG